MAPRKIIIDTDPGVDDVLAMLLALSAFPEELEILLLSITYGNIDVQNCLRNVVSMFSHIGKEIAWRREKGKPLGFDALRKQSKPIVAVGPECPLADQILMADYFHGRDGLGGIHESHPHLTPADTWKKLFEHKDDPSDAGVGILGEADLDENDTLFIPSSRPASEEILRLLRENEPDTITIVAVGPLTNLAIAAAKDPEIFLRVKEVVVMGGTLHEHGNITPVAEFNTFADAVAAARVYALSSPNPNSTLPPAAPSSKESDFLSAYPSGLTRRLRVTLFTLDITEQHLLTRGLFRTVAQPLLEEKSPLAEWVSAFLNSTLHKVETLSNNVSGDAVALQLHDPMCIWYCMTDASAWKISDETDIRVETAGQWTRGQCILDRRPRRRREPGDDGEKAGDTGNWLSLSSGNRLRYALESPGQDIFGDFLLQRIFALED